MRRIRITVSYDGTAYHGWQVQPNLPTIQAALEGALAEIEGAHVHVTGSGRTDAGVHALAQTAAFDLANPIPEENLLKAMNRLLPHDIRVFEVAEGGFWQVHPGAPQTLVQTVLEMLDPQEGEAVLDLYAGVGLFARFLAEKVGPQARVVAVEGDHGAAAAAKRNLSGLAKVKVSAGPVAGVLATEHDEPFDLVVLDPPREGARRRVVQQIVDRAPRAIAYVACDPAALARDLATFDSLGYSLSDLRAFDLFPMTSHVEVVAKLVKSDSEMRSEG